MSDNKQQNYGLLSIEKTFSTHCTVTLGEDVIYDGDSRYEARNCYLTLIAKGGKPVYVSESINTMPPGFKFTKENAEETTIKCMEHLPSRVKAVYQKKLDGIIASQEELAEMHLYHPEYFGYYKPAGVQTDL